MTRGIARAMAKSAALLEAAAAAGDAEAQFSLALLYLVGRGVDKNLGEAFKLFQLAADAGDTDAEAFKGIAAEAMARAQLQDTLMQDAGVEVMKDAKRRQRFPKPRLVEPD